MKSVSINDLQLFHGDCMDYMKSCDNNAFDLAIVDPPYGIDAAKDNRFGVKNNGAVLERTAYEKKEWDKDIPDEKYFNQLFRISKNQIIWGVNYYTDARLTGGRIYWDKLTADNYSNSSGELAYKSKGYGTDCFKFRWHGMLQGDMKKKEKRIHPTQKPVKLYEWLLTKYAEPNQKILDTHLGSGSSAIAAHYFGCEFTGIELDEDYFNASIERITDQTRQMDLLA